MGTPKGAYSDWELIRSYQDTLVYLEKDDDCSVAVELDASKERGRVVVTLTAYDLRPGASERPLARCQTDWPGAKPLSFPACLYQAAMALVRLVEDSRADAEKLLAPRQVTPRRRK